MSTKYLFSLLLFFVLCSCKKTNTTETKTETTNDFTLQQPIKKLDVKYAKGFEVSYFSDYKVVTILQTNFTNIKKVQYVLVNRGKSLPANLPKEAITVEIPLKSIVCLSTTHAPLLEEIGEVEKIVGFSGIGYSAVLEKYTEKQKITEVGGQNGLANLEQIVNLQPSGVMLYDENSFHKLFQLGQKPVLNTEYLETSPLGRAEWIKFASVFFDKEDLADKYFSQIAQNYESIKAKLAKTSNKPQVFGTVPYNNIWYMPAGESFVATLWQDAGANYLWQYSEGTGSLQLSVEEVVHKAYLADIWINVGSIASIKELIATDNRFAAFKALKTKQVYNCNKRITKGGGNEYYEYGVTKPDMILQDLVNILYPNLLENKELYFYQQLK